MHPGVQLNPAGEGNYERGKNMKFTKKRDYSGSIRKVWSDDKKVCFGIVGTVADLLEEEIFEFCAYNPETWAFLPVSGTPVFGESRDSVMEAGF